jgi:hypothetical protein
MIFSLIRNTVLGKLFSGIKLDTWLIVKPILNRYGTLVILSLYLFDY